ncbi:chaplin [Streptomyces sp. NPDC004237]|uniref:chaplin n=1 Tax=Streptomyces sp. NPDC004237 TaxID=3154455 RepID=UPI0033BD8CA0
MRQSLSRGMFAAAAATSILSLYASPALAGSDANGAANGSPGVLSGNNVQAPVNVPINVCGNSVDAVGALNPAFGNSCANESHTHEHTTGRTHEPPHGDSGYGDNSGHGSEGPRETPPPYGHETPPPYGDESSPPCDETPPSTPPTPPPPRHSTPPTPPGHSTPPTPPGHSTPPSPPGHTTPPGPSTPPRRTTPPGGNHQAPPPTLAHTGTEALLASSAAGAALIAGGTILYRRGRTASRRP